MSIYSRKKSSLLKNKKQMRNNQLVQEPATEVFTPF